MILHASVTVDRPEETARLLAELIGGEAMPLEDFSPGAWMALANDGHGTLVQCLPRGVEFHWIAGQTVAHRRGAPMRESGFHLLLETACETDQVLELAGRRGAQAHVARHGPLELIELWIDGALLIEIATPTMAAAYRAASTVPQARALTGGAGGAGGGQP